VQAGVLAALIFFVAHPDPGLQMCAMCEPGSSGFPTATKRASAFVANASTASNSALGTAPVSSITMSTLRAWIP
jgi:hypothetical protein